MKYLLFLLVGIFVIAESTDEDFDIFDGEVKAEVLKKTEEFQDFEDSDSYNALSGDKFEDTSTPSIEILNLTNTDILRGYHWESFIISACVAYVIFYIYGRLKNESISEDWHEKCLTLLQEEFAQIGDRKDCQTELVKENDALFRIWCSGRKNMNGMLVELQLSRRFCGLNFILSGGKMQDRLCLTVEFGSEELDTFVTLIYFDSRITKKAINKRISEYPDLSRFCIERKRSTCRVFSEVMEPVDMLQSDNHIQSLVSRNIIRMIHISDQYKGPVKENAESITTCSKIMFVDFNIGVDDISCIKLVLHLADKLAQFKLGREAKQRAIKNRQIVEDQAQKSISKQRQELAKQRKEDKRKGLGVKDPEELQRMEEKQTKKDARKKQQRVKQMMVRSF